MAVKSSPLSPLDEWLCGSVCQSCGLYLRQRPVTESARSATIFWVGLSAVLFEEGEEMLPLAPSTATGSLIQHIEAPHRNEISFYKTNLVKCAPVNERERVRYPSESEMGACFQNFEKELAALRPQIVFLLGKQVATFVLKKLGGSKPIFSEDFETNPILIDNTYFVPVHHPSYILVYKRKRLNQYVESIRATFRKYLTRKSSRKARLPVLEEVVC